MRELKECRFRLRLLRGARFLTAEHDPVIEESRELVSIVAAIVRKAEGKRRKPPGAS